MNPQQERCARLADAIVRILTHKRTIDPDLLHFIDTMLSRPSAKDLTSIINDPSDDDADAVVELIFYPDESMQALLEPIIESNGFIKADEAVLADTLILKKPAAHMLFPDGRGDIAVVMPDWIAAPFISRLNISCRPDQRLIDAIYAYIPDERQAVLMVKLRNFKSPLTDSAISFLVRFFESMPFQEKTSGETFDMMLALLAEIGEQDIYTGLVEKKKFYTHHLKNAQEYEEQLEKSNMEIMMLQGNRQPYLDKQDALIRIAVIDAVCLTVFGMVPFPGQAAGGSFSFKV